MSLSALGIFFYQLLSQTDSPYSGNHDGHHHPMRHLILSATTSKELSTQFLMKSQICVPNYWPEGYAILIGLLASTESSRAWVGPDTHG